VRVSAQLPLSVVGFLRACVDSLARRITRELADRGLVRVAQSELIELTVPSIEDRLALADLALRRSS
jgi:hypothetical protein